MLPISVCIIAKNEEKYIETCLKSLCHYDWEIIVTDTGSSDKTLEIARKYTSSIYHFDWNNNFSDARNYCIAQASNPWVLNIDCDEYLENQESAEELLSKLLPLLSAPENLGMIHIRNPLAASQHMASVEPVARLFHKAYYHYEGNVHEQPLPIRKDMSPKYADTPLEFYHAGYADESILKQKATRNIQLLQEALQKDSDNPYLWQQLGQCYYVQKKYEQALQAFDHGLSFDVDPRLQYVQNMVEAYGYCLLELKQYPQALQLQNIYDEFCCHADFVFLMGLIYMNNGFFSEAITEFLNATTIKNHSVSGINSYLAFYNAGIIYECLGQKEDALRYYRKCKNYEPALQRISSLTGLS